MALTGTANWCPPPESIVDGPRPRSTGHLHKAQSLGTLGVVADSSLCNTSFVTQESVADVARQRLRAPRTTPSRKTLIATRRLLRVRYTLSNSKLVQNSNARRGHLPQGYNLGRARANQQLSKIELPCPYCRSSTCSQLFTCTTRLLSGQVPSM